MICRIAIIFVLLSPGLAIAEGPNPFGDPVAAPNPFGNWEPKSDWDMILNESMATPQDCPDGICATPNAFSIEPVPDSSIQVADTFKLSEPGTTSYWTTDTSGNRVHVTETWTVSNPQNVCPDCGRVRTNRVFANRQALRRRYGIFPRLREARANGRRPVAEFWGAFSGAAGRAFVRRW